MSTTSTPWPPDAQEWSAKLALAITQALVCRRPGCTSHLLKTCPSDGQD
jgi:hypothetical protein